MAVDEDYAQALLGLLPPGPAWPDDAAGAPAKLLGGSAVEFARLDMMGNELLSEADPRITLAFLRRWELICGLMTVAATLTQRQLTAFEIVTRRGGQTAEYYIALAARLGFTSTITTFDEFSVDSDVDQLLNGVDWAFAWQLNFPATLSNVIDFTVDSDVDTPLSIFSSALDVTPFQEYKPAHTTVLFSYQ